MEIIWTNTAKQKLNDIFDYYKINSNVDNAKNIVSQIVDKTLILSNLPKIGTIEELLKHRKNEYRYIIDKNYKIIYWIEKNNICIATVFDCRQNPIKITGIK